MNSSSSAVHRAEAEAPAIQITPDDGAAIVKGKEMLATLEGYTSGAARDKRAAQLAPAPPARVSLRAALARVCDPSSSLHC